MLPAHSPLYGLRNDRWFLLGIVMGQLSRSRRRVHFAAPGYRLPLDDASLRKLLLAYDPSNRPVLDEVELFEALAPALRADIESLRSYSVSDAVAPLQSDLVLLSAANDPIASAEAAAPWARFFAGEIRHEILPGGHFFVFREAEATVVAHLGDVVVRAAWGK